MTDKIKNNLVLKADFEQEKSKAGILTGKTKFYIIGVLPVVFILPTGKKEVVKLQAREEIPINDPSLRNIMGVMASDIIKQKKYSAEIDKIVANLNEALLKIKIEKNFFKKQVADVAIIKF